MEQTRKQKLNTERLTVSAIMIALASVLSLFTPLALPQGGGITIMSMLPIILISYRYGLKWGTATAFIYSVIQLLFGFSTVSAYPFRILDAVRHASRTAVFIFHLFDEIHLFRRRLVRLHLALNKIGFPVFDCQQIGESFRKSGIEPSPILHFDFTDVRSKYRKPQLRQPQTDFVLK